MRRGRNLFFLIHIACDNQIIDLVFYKVFQNGHWLELAGVNFKHDAELIIIGGYDDGTFVRVRLVNALPK